VRNGEGKKDWKGQCGVIWTGGGGAWKHKWMDGRTDGWMDGRTGGWVGWGCGVYGILWCGMDGR